MEIWGHRGAYHFAPENTLTGFQIAADMGADGVELDIQLTKDGEAVVIHDETIDRVSSGRGRVIDYTLSELKKFNFNKRGITPPMFMEIPTLSETLALLAPTGMKVNIELKTGVVFYEGIEEKALSVAGRFGMGNRIIWSSFNHFSVQNIKRLDPSAQTALLSGGQIFVTGEQCEKTGAYALHPHIKQLLYPGLAKECRDRGIKIHVWGVNEPKHFGLALDAGVDAVITDRLELLYAR
jgi:glycerophosphoryl diester phosphodiesterase